MMLGPTNNLSLLRLLRRGTRDLDLSPKAGWTTIMADHTTRLHPNQDQDFQTQAMIKPFRLHLS